MTMIRARCQICRTVLVAMMGMCWMLAAQEGSNREDMVQSFELVERFGVSHPEQIVDFDLDVRVDPGNVYLLGPEGTEVPYQLLDGGKKLAVRTDLPAGAEKSWRLMSGRAPTPVTDGVRVVETEAYYEIVNGLIGVRVAKPVSTADDTWKPLFDLIGADDSLPRVYLPAPVQGVLYRDGIWSGVGPNGLAALATAFEDMAVTFRERGPLKTVVEVTFRFTRPAAMFKEEILREAGPAHYRCVLDVQAGQPSVLFEEESDTDITWSMNLYGGLQPTQARFQAHHATKPEYGRKLDGTVYQGLQRGEGDALVDLSYEHPMPSTSRRTERTWRRMAVWDPWIYDSGWYWQAYNAGAPATANLLGIFAGRASRALGAGDCGTGIFTLPPAEIAGQPRMGLTVALYGRRQDVRHRFAPLSRYQWGLFLGVKGADLGPQDTVQPIARQMNLHAGVSLNKLRQLAFAFPDPPGGYGSIYMDPTVIQRMIDRVRRDPDYDKTIWEQHTNPAHRRLPELWVDESGEKAAAGAETLANNVAGRLNTLIHGNGIYDFGLHYWMGGRGMIGDIEFADQLLATGQLAAEHKSLVKAVQIINAAVLWDDDFAPLTESHGLNLGNANMPIMQNGMRQQAALYLPEHPMMTSRLAGLGEGAKGLLNASINEHGAHQSAIGYITTSQPQFATLLMLQNAGIYDAFRQEPRLRKFAEFLLNVLTPAECRFNNRRKLLPVGDSSTNGDPLMGYLATGFAEVDPELSAQLMGGWRAMDSPQGTFYGPTLLRINQELPATPPALRDAAFPGYYSVLRHGCNTPDETVAWCVNGNTYGDHAHNDLGAVIVYALGAPLSMDWSGRYPSVKAGMFHSTVIEEKFFGPPWDKGEGGDPLDPRESGGAGLSGHSGYVAPAKARQEELLSLGTFGRMASRIDNRGLVWRRVVTRLNGNPELPVILIEDTFDGEDADQPKIFTLNLMAEGAVETPAGAMTPPLRDYDYDWSPREERKKEPPSAGPVFALEPGLHRLSFTGQVWAQHPTQGIDWDLYLLNDEPQQAHISNWAIFWQPHEEQAQFKAANGRPYEERQHILRVRGTTTFTALLLPWRKGAKPADLRVERDGESLRMLARDRATTLGPTVYVYEGPNRRVLAALTEAPVEDAGIRIEGGPTEVALAADRGSVTVHGAAGVRKIELPGTWRIADSHPSCQASFGLFRRSTLSVTYAGGAPGTIHLEKR